jgi:hypothetical protein
MMLLEEHEVEFDVRIDGRRRPLVVVPWHEIEAWKRCAAVDRYERRKQETREALMDRVGVGAAREKLLLWINDVLTIGMPRLRRQEKAPGAVRRRGLSET